MTENDLDYIFRPRGIAVVGASRKEGSFGNRVVRCIVEGGYQGPLYPINPNAKVISSLPAYKRVQDVPGPVDLAVIVIPAPAVIQAIDQCAQAGVKGVVVISAGFKEIGPAGEALEKELVLRVKKHGMRMVGPNCMGVINTDPQIRMNATFAPAYMRPGRIAFLSQSGAMGMAILKYADELEIGLSMYVSVGNKADVSANDLLEYWKDNHRADAILLYMEGFGNPRRFTQIARSITPHKPVIAVKAGRTPSGAQAADYHTGEPPATDVSVSTDAAVDALFNQCGVLRVQTLEEMFDLARAMVGQPLPNGKAVAVLTNGGGPGIMASDALEGLELEVPPLDPRTISELKRFLPREASFRNPVDMRADADADTYRRIIPLLLLDPNVDVLLIIYVGFAYKEVADAIGEAVKGSKKPALVSLMGGKNDDPGIRSLLKKGVPVYAFPESACKVIADLATYRKYLERPAGKIKRYRNVERDTVSSIIAEVRREGREELTLEEVRSVARAYGASILKSAVAGSEKEAREIADKIGYPVVVKVLSPKLRKKSDVGGVILDLRTPAEVKAAYTRAIESVRFRFPSAQIEGVLVQQMLKGGQELIMGADLHPIFGSVLKVGAGGPYAEIFRDFQFRIVPITPQDAMEMIRSLKIFPLLESQRGRENINLTALVDALCRASQLIEDFEQIKEFEINPLILLPRKKDFFAVDGRMRLFKET